MGTWMTSDRKTADLLTNEGHQLIEPKLDGMVLYYVFENSDDLSDTLANLAGRFEDVGDKNDSVLWKTDDMMAVAWMKMNGIHPSETRWEGHSMFWVFDDTDEMADLCAEYIGVISRPVDLRLYNETVAEIRRAMLQRRDEHFGSRHSRASSS